MLHGSTLYCKMRAVKKGGLALAPVQNDVLQWSFRKKGTVGAMRKLVPGSTYRGHLRESRKKLRLYAQNPAIIHFGDLEHFNNGNGVSHAFFFFFFKAPTQY